MKMKKRFISILLCLAMLLGMLPKTNLTLLAADYSSQVEFYDLEPGDILNPGAEISAYGSMTVILQAEGWISEGSYVAVGEPKQFQTQTISIGNEGCIEVTEEYGHTNCYPYANGEKVSTWTVVETSWESNTITLTGYSSSSGTITFTESKTLNKDIDGCVTIKGYVELYLNGHTIKGDGQHSTITITEGSTLVLLDNTDFSNWGMIVGGGGDKGGGVLVSQNATFVLQSGIIGGTGGGDILYNEATDGGGVYVDGGTFEMFGGVIENNKATSGGGVYVNDGTFNMHGGLIAGNITDYWAGGGVYNCGEFNMSGGTIEQNSAATEGGGIYSTGTLNVTGGEISNNKCDGTDKGYAGVCINDGIFILSGGPVIDSNTHGSTEEDICLYPGKVIDVTGTLTMANTMSVRRTDSNGNDNLTGVIAQGSDGYTLTEADGGKFVASTTDREAVFDSTNQNEQLVAVSTFSVTYNGNGNTSGTVPVDSNSPYSSGSTVTVLGNTGSLAKDNSTFNGWNTAADGSGTSYAANATFSITEDTTLYAQWDEVSHSHSWSYTSNGATITATCSGAGNCDITEGLTLTISAPAGTLVYDGTTTYPAALSTGYNTTAFPDAYSISYTKDNTAFNGTPKDAGVYTASVTVDTVTASVSYTIAMADPATPTGLTATYGQTLADVTLPTGWAWEDSTMSVGSVGTNSFKANYTAPNANYNSKTGVDVEVTVSAADVVITKAPTANTLTYNGQEQELVTAGEATGGTMWYALGENATTAPADNLYTTSISAKTDAGTYYVWYKVVGDENHSGSDAACVSVNIAKVSNTVTVSITGWTYGGYDSTVNAPTATATWGNETVSYTYSDRETGTYTETVPENAGTYYVKATVTETENYNGAESEPVSFVISPKSLTDDMLALSAVSFEHDGNVHTPMITVKDGTKELVKDTDYTVDTTSTTSGTAYGAYTIRVNGKGNYTGSVSKGWEITDNKAPEIEITIKESSIKTAFNAITFGLFFNETETVTITATDAGSGVDQVYYFTSGTAVSSVDELITLAGENWTEGKSFSKDPNVKFIVYAKVTDKKGNTGYAASNGVVLDNTKPVVKIDGANAESEYHKAVSWTAEDENLDNVVITFTAEGEAAGTEIYNQSATAGATQLAGESSLSELGSYTITAKDKADNSTEVTFAITGRAAEITGSDKTTDFEEGKTYDLKQIFTVEDGVSVSTYAIVGNADESVPAGTGTIDGSQLTITRAGLITIKATVAKGKTVPAVPETAAEYIKETTATGTLSVGKADGSAGITVADTVYGNGITALISSSTNAVASSTITYTMTADAAGKEIPEANRTESETKPVQVGTYKAVVTYGTTGLYKEVSAETTFQITPAALTVTAEAKEKTYGSADPALTYTVSGLKYEDKADSVLSGVLTRAEGENAGTYAITQGTLKANENYTISYTEANLTISKATLTVTAEAKSKSYGKDDPELTYQVSGLKNGDTVGVLTGALTRDSGEDVGTYAITQGTLAANGNYTISFTGADFKITKIEAAVTAPEANNLTYNGKEQALVKAGAAEGGEVQYALGTNADTAPEADAENTPEAEKKWSASIPTGTDAGTYYVWYKAVGNGNYKDSDAVCIAVSIAKASITIRADDISSKYGEELKELTYRVSGAYVEGDSLGVSVSTIATRFSAPSEYPTVVSWNNNSNYQATLVDGTYTITQNELEVNASGYTGTYDGKEHGIQVEVLTDNTQNNSVPNNSAKIYYASVELTDDNYKTLGSTLNLLYTNVGEYTVYYYVDPDNDGLTPAKGSATVSIEKAAPEVTAPEPVTGLSYTGEEQILVTAGSATGAEILYATNGKDYSGEPPSGIEAGSYTVFYYYKGDQNHTDLGSADSPQGSFHVMISSTDMICISGHVFESDGSTPISGANVRLMKGKEQIAVSVTISGGAYQLVADEGRYNVIVEWNRDDANDSQDLVTKTELLNLKTETELDIVMPSGKVNSILQVTEGTPDVLVGGLDEEAALASEGASNVSVTMTVEKKEQGDGSETDALKEFAADKKLEYLSITVEKTVDSVTTVMAETQTVMEIIIPYSHLEKKGLMVYRCHNSETVALKEAETKEDGTFHIDKKEGLVYIYTNRFSTYAIGYSAYYTVGSSLKLGSYTGEATVTLQKQGESENVKQETVFVENGAASYDMEDIPKGTYNMTIKWKDGKENTLVVPVNVE